MRAADANQVPAGGALAVDRDGFSARVTAALEAASADRRSCATRCRAAAAGLGQRHRRHRPAHLARARRSDPRAHRRGCTRLLRRHRADRAPRLDRSRVAWFQSRYDKAGPGGSGADYINCPLTREQYDAFVDALLAGDKIAVPRLGSDHALFRRLPADRGDGRARTRDAAPRPDEAVRPDQSAQRRSVKPYAVVQLRQDNKLGTLFNMVGFQTKLKHGEQSAHLPHHSRPGERRVRAARRPAPQHLPQFAEAARCDAAAQGRSAAALRRPDHRLRGLCRIGRHRADRRPLRRRRAARRADAAAAADHGAWRAARAHHRRPCRDHRRRPASFQPMNVNFGLFPPLAAPVAPEGRKSAAARPRTWRSKRALSARALADLEHWIGGARRPPRRNDQALENPPRIARRAPQHPLPPPLRQRLGANGSIATPLHAIERGPTSATGRNAGRISARRGI